MFFKVSQKHKKLAQLLLGGLFFFLFLFAFPYGLMTDAGGKMLNCPFSPGHSSICKDTPLEHIQEWQSVFTVLPDKGVLVSALLLLGLLLLGGVRNILTPVSKNPNFLYKPRRLQLSIFDPLKEAFSSGILNPKIYHLA